MINKKKVCYIISDIDKALAFEWVATHLNKKDLLLSFVLLNPGNSILEEFLIGQNIQVKRINIKGKKNWAFASIKLYKHLKKTKPDIVHCHLLTANILGLLTAKIAGVKIRIYTRHHSDYHHRYFKKGVYWDKLSNKLSTKIIAPSNAVRIVLEDLEKVSSSKITTIPHGFDFSYFRQISEITKEEIEKKYNPTKKRPVVGVISRFTKLKGIQFIIPAFMKFLDSHPNALLLFFGAVGDYEDELQNMLCELPSQSWKTIGFENNLAGVYSLFDVFIQASTDTTIEAFGQTYVEALAAQVPSIFTLSGIATDFVIHGKNALVVPFEDSEAIYQSMIMLIRDNQLRENLKKEGWISVQDRFALKNMISSLEQLYLE